MLPCQPRSSLQWPTTKFTEGTLSGIDRRLRNAWPSLRHPLQHEFDGPTDSDGDPPDLGVAAGNFRVQVYIDLGDEGGKCNEGGTLLDNAVLKLLERCPEPNLK